MKTAVGYFSNCAIDHEEAAAFERAAGSYPTRQETLNYYLETLTMALEELGGGHPHDPFPSEYDSSSRPTRRYRYFEVPWAKPTVQDLLARSRRSVNLFGAQTGKRTVSEMQQETPPAGAQRNV